jgi:hemoglobin-like flavoprotein
MTSEAKMPPQTVALVRQSWTALQPMRKQVCRRFYDCLFERHPEVRPLFKGDIDRQASLFVTMLNTAVSALENPEPVVPLLRTVGARHADYGVRDADYEKFSDALMQTFAETLGDAFTPDVRAAWEELYGLLADTMQAGAHQRLQR